MHEWEGVWEGIELAVNIYVYMHYNGGLCCSKHWTISRILNNRSQKLVIYVYMRAIIETNDAGFG